MDVGIIWPLMDRTLTRAQMPAEPPGPKLQVVSRGGHVARGLHLVDTDCPETHRRRGLRPMTFAEAVKGGWGLCWRCERALPELNRRWLDAGAAIDSLIRRVDGTPRWRSSPPRPVGPVGRLAAVWDLANLTDETVTGNPVAELARIEDPRSGDAARQLRSILTGLAAQWAPILVAEQGGAGLRDTLDLTAAAVTLPGPAGGRWRSEVSTDIAARETWVRKLRDGFDPKEARREAEAAFARAARSAGVESMAKRYVTSLVESARDEASAWSSLGLRAGWDPRGRLRAISSSGEDDDPRTPPALRVMAAVSTRSRVRDGDLYLMPALWLLAIQTSMGGFVDLGEVTGTEEDALRSGEVPEVVAGATAIADADPSGTDLLDVARSLLA